MKPSVLPRKQESGYMLLEVLIAMLVFSIGILGLINLQAVTMLSADSTKLRGTACMLADELVGSMWAGDRASENLIQNYSSDLPGPEYELWLAKVVDQLPGAAQTRPMVQIMAREIPDPVSGGVLLKTFVTIIIYWQLPSERSSNTLHNYIATSQITP